MVNRNSENEMIKNTVRESICFYDDLFYQRTNCECVLCRSVKPTKYLSIPSNRKAAGEICRFCYIKDCFRERKNLNEWTFKTFLDHSLMFANFAIFAFKTLAELTFLLSIDFILFARWIIIPALLVMLIF